jgi:hypothetical protein
MEPAMLRSMHVPGAVLCLLLSATPAHAQAWGGGLSPAERQELTSYRLTMGNVSKAAVAGAKLEELSKTDPTFKQWTSKDEGRTLTDAIAKLNGVPAVRSAVESSGLDAKQFLYTIIELATSQAAVKMEAAGGNSAKMVAQLPTSAQNIAFYAEHQAQLDPLTYKITHAGKDSTD